MTERNFAITMPDRPLYGSIPYTIILPHYKTKITAYAVYKLLQHTKGRDVNILVVDNSNGEGTEYMEPFRGKISLIKYPADKMQSHGIAYDYCLQNDLILTEHFITVESDSFPTQDNWLDYYDNLIKHGYDSAGSLLALSGGVFMHPAGALYRKSIWGEAKAYVDTIQYEYFPNMAMKDGFPCHLMVHDNILVNFIRNPSLYVDLHHSYKPVTSSKIIDQVSGYRPISDGVFHNGMGNSQESIKTYAHRNIVTEPGSILLDNNSDLIYRMGYEPAQWFCYWQIAMGKSMKYIPTQVIWMSGRHGQQQEYTLMDNGFLHIWGITAYSDCKSDELNDIIVAKNNKMNELYDSMPDEFKIK